ncbi:MAG: flagellar protein F [Candidatus Thermoplasmatota archaeon]|jgi:flagellar protein FlaF|nr:flagellar protein F [Candidatus Thermoplasmatota archaeon]MCL5955365.1 flagellar protein F [Candidatus Thermoplasmatota archaeon]
MGFSYVVAVAILLSSSLIFFGIIYSDYVHTETQINDAQHKAYLQNYDYMNSKVSIDNYSYAASGSNFTVTLNVTNTGSVTLNMNHTNVLVNGSLVNFTYGSQYLFPLGNDTITFITGAGTHNVEMVFNTGYEKFEKVVIP